jgi:hypothetical protein
MSAEGLAVENMSRIMDWTYESIQRGRRGDSLAGIDREATESILRRDGLIPQRECGDSLLEGGT